MELNQLFLQSLKGSITITAIIFVLMILIEIIILKYKHKIHQFLKKNKVTSYIISSFFGIMPGCVGTFAMDSAYMGGLLSFGGLTAAMIATSGDETFIMISMLISGELQFISVIGLIISLFVLGILGGVIADFVKKKLKFKTCKKCKIQHHKEEEFKLKHFIKVHIYKHIIKKHIWQIFIWVFIALFLIGLGTKYMNLEQLLSGTNMLYLLIIAAIVGLLPISGPNIFLIVLFSQGMIPFSILLTNSIIQDGHGLLPIIGFSIDDAIKIKIINFAFGLVIGIILLTLGF